jgi:hypothetical protein
MPINATQLALGANYQLEAYAANDPVDQVNTTHPTMAWLVSHKQVTEAGNTYFNEKVRIGNDSNYQNYYGDDQVSYNRKDTVRLAKFPWANFHDGFGVNEDELAANGITLTDDKDATLEKGEKSTLVNIMKENFETLKLGVQENFALEVLLDGTSNTKAIPGLDFLVSTTPSVGVVGGIDAATSTYWRNNASMAISLATPGNLTTKMEQMWRACMLYGGRAPNYIPVGQAFLDAYRAEFAATIVRQAQVGGGPTQKMDVATVDLYFHGIQLTWDPDFERLDALLGAITYPWTKRAYFLNSEDMKLRPLKGHWMVNRKPPRMYDRYVYYFAITSKYRLTVRRRNSMAVLSIA